MTSEFWPDRKPDDLGTRSAPYQTVPLRISPETFETMQDREHMDYTPWKERLADGKFYAVQRQYQFGHAVYFAARIIICLKAAI